jgi:RimJ/RimL family protein N-acetyltransferase
MKLRPWRESDADDCAAACNDPLIQRYLPLLARPYTRQDALTWFANQSGTQYAVVDPDTDRLLGAVGLVPHGKGVAEVGYWVAPWARGRGIATAAVNAITAEAFEVGLVRLYLSIKPDNATSQRVALAAGYQREGIARGAGRDRDGGYHDMVIWGRLASDPPGKTARLLPDLPGGRLTDGTVTLQPLGTDDTDDTFRLHTLDDVVATSVPPVPPDRAAVEARCANAEARWLEGVRATLTIRDAASGTYAGDLGLFYNDPPLAQAMLGYSLLPEWRGRGFAARAVRLVAAWAFAEVGLVRLIAGTASDNVASQRVLESAGFTREAYQVALLPGPNGTRIDNIQYVRVAPETSPAG